MKNKRTNSLKYMDVIKKVLTLNDSVTPYYGSELQIHEWQVCLHYKNQIYQHSVVWYDD